MTIAYLEVIELLGRLRRQFLELVKIELDRHGVRDINNTQALMLFRLGDAEMRCGDLILTGCYEGTNPCHNVQKLVNHGYLVHTRSLDDRRVRSVRLTDKGRAIRDCCGGDAPGPFCRYYGASPCNREGRRGSTI